MCLRPRVRAVRPFVQARSPVKGKPVVFVNVQEILWASLPVSAEAFGAGWSLFMHDVHGDDVSRPWRVLKISRSKWERLEPDAAKVIDDLSQHSYVKFERDGRKSLPRAVRVAVYERDGGVCRYCETPVSSDEFHVDHVNPVARGGGDEMNNLACACRPCNLSKRDKTLDEWRAAA